MAKDNKTGVFGESFGLGWDTVEKEDYKKAGKEATKELELVLDLSRENDDCQKLINYLVYLEALL